MAKKQTIQDKRKMLKGGSTTIQLVMTKHENKIVEFYRYKFRIRDKRAVIRKMIRELNKLEKEQEKE